MTLTDLTNLLVQLGIEVVNASCSSRLGDDADMDSQEIVELRALIAKHFGVKIPPKALNKQSTLGDVLACVQSENTAQVSPTQTPPASHEQIPVTFDGTLTTSLQMNCPAQQAYDALFRVADWPKQLPHVTDIQVLYDDGVYQEFLMTVASPAGKIEVRSVRRCKDDQISFFQPTAPKFLTHHSGGWKFEDIGHNRSKVTTFHRWNLSREEAAKTFPANGKSTEQQVHELLLEHAKFALSTWKERLEPSVSPSQRVAV